MSKEDGDYYQVRVDERAEVYDHTAAQRVREEELVVLLLP
jgi:hypothetical protein